MEKPSEAVKYTGLGVGPGRLDGDHDSQDQGQRKVDSVELHLWVCLG